MTTDDKDLVERLRARGSTVTEGHPDKPGGRRTYAPLVNPDGPEAADRIEQLSSALKPFAHVGEVMHADDWCTLKRDTEIMFGGEVYPDGFTAPTVTYGDFRNAYSALQSLQVGGE
jgi:hypothetical protein